MHSELGNNHSNIFILGFRNGSVFADFLFLLPKEEAMDVGDIETRLSNVLRSKFGNKSKVQSKWCWKSFSVMVLGWKGQIYCC